MEIIVCLPEQPSAESLSCCGLVASLKRGIWRGWERESHEALSLNLGCELLLVEESLTLVLSFDVLLVLCRSLSEASGNAVPTGGYHGRDEVDDDRAECDSSGQGGDDGGGVDKAHDEGLGSVTEEWQTEEDKGDVEAAEHSGHEDRGRVLFRGHVVLVVDGSVLRFHDGTKAVADHEGECGDEAERDKQLGSSPDEGHGEIEDRHFVVVGRKSVDGVGVHDEVGEAIIYFYRRGRMM